MSADIPNRVIPVGESELTRPLTEHHGGTPGTPPHRGRIIAGVVTAVHARMRRTPEPGRHLDISVGEESAHTEIVVRVPAGAYHDLEGHHVVLHIEE